MSYDDLLDAVRRLERLMAAPSPGLSTFHLILRDLMHEVRDKILRAYPLTANERDIDEVRAELVELYTPEETDEFLRKKQPYLGDKTPLVVIAAGGKADVLAGIRALKEGAFA